MSFDPGISPNGAAAKSPPDVGSRMDRVLAESKTTPIARASTRPAPELTVVVPTFNERTNVPLLVARLQRTLDGIDWEVVFVDDNSPDGTAAAARALGAGDARVRCIRRIGRRGLAGACLEGMLASQARFVAVMDADLQHDESKLDARSVLEFFALVLSKLTHDAVSFRFLMYCLVGLTGVVIHMAALTAALDVAGLTFGPAQTAATIVAIGWNFALNNAVTYR